MNELNGKIQKLVAVDRFSKWPTVKICETSETKEVINILTQYFDLYTEYRKSLNRIKVEHSFLKKTPNFANRKTLKYNTAHREHIQVREQLNA